MTASTYRLRSVVAQGRGLAMASSPPLIFSPIRRSAARHRAVQMQRAPGAAHYILDDMIEDVLERLAFLRHEPRRSLVVGDRTGRLAAELGGEVAELDPISGLNEERPYPLSGFDLVVSLATLDTVNDLPGALIHLRNALAPGGLVIAQFLGAGSLPALRAAMLAADGDRPAPRLHPMVDVRAGGQLLQRAGWADPVVDCRSLEVRFGDFGSLLRDLRAQSLGNVLDNPGPDLSRKQYSLAKETFGTATLERFEIVTLSGWRRPSTGSG